MRIKNYEIDIKISFFRVKSPQQIMGSLVKSYVPEKMKIDPARVYHVTVMPCFDKVRFVL